MNIVKEFIVPPITKATMPLSFGDKKNKSPKNGVVLAGDIGGTKTNLVLLQVENGQFKTLKEKRFSTKDYRTFLDMVEAFHNNKLPAIDSICLGVAGPIINGKVKGVNFPWEIDDEEIAIQLNVKSVSVLNDMEANAYGLAALQKHELKTIKKGDNVSGNAVIISPGTGLGEAGLFWDGSQFHPFASEGGHCDFCPRNETEAALWQFMHQRYKHVSWERVLSGPGIFDMYQFLIEYRSVAEPKGIREKMKEINPSAAISYYAIEKKDPICLETLDLFTRLLGVEAAQLALKMKATGGVFIGGGIVPKILKGLDMNIFKRGFVQSGRLDVLLELIPVKVVLNDKTALLGAAYHGAMAL